MCLFGDNFSFSSIFRKRSVKSSEFQSIVNVVYVPNNNVMIIEVQSTSSRNTHSPLTNYVTGDIDIADISNLVK